MWAMFKQFWAFLSAVFAAGEHAGNALRIIAAETENMAQAYVDEKQFEREESMAELHAKREARLAAKGKVKAVKAIAAE